MSNQYKITEEQKKQLLQISAQTLPDNPSREGYSAEQIRGRLYKCSIKYSTLQVVVIYVNIRVTR